MRDGARLGLGIDVSTVLRRTACPGERVCEASFGKVTHNCLLPVWRHLEKDEEVSRADRKLFGIRRVRPVVSDIRQQLEDPNAIGGVLEEPIGVADYESDVPLIQPLKISQAVVEGVEVPSKVARERESLGERIVKVVKRAQVRAGKNADQDAVRVASEATDHAGAADQYVEPSRPLAACCSLETVRTPEGRSPVVELGAVLWPADLLDAQRLEPIALDVDWSPTLINWFMGSRWSDLRNEPLLHRTKLDEVPLRFDE